MVKRLLLATMALIALGAAGQARATCVSSTPISAPDPGAGTTCSITAAASTVDIVFAYKSAADVDVLLNGKCKISRRYYVFTSTFWRGKRLAPKPQFFPTGGLGRPDPWLSEGRREQERRRDASLFRANDASGSFESRGPV
jgi:hypothetical protein